MCPPLTVPRCTNHTLYALSVCVSACLKSWCVCDGWIAVASKFLLAKAHREALACALHALGTNCASDEAVVIAEVSVR